MYAYLQTSVRNACINYREHEKVEHRYEQEILHTEEEAFDWQEVGTVKEMRQKLLDAIDRLPEKCRQIFMMSCVDGLKYREIASRMDISENTVKTQIKLAYKKLREDINISGGRIIDIYHLVVTLEKGRASLGVRLCSLVIPLIVSYDSSFRPRSIQHAYILHSPSIKLIFDRHILAVRVCRVVYWLTGKVYVFDCIGIRGL